MTPAVPDSPLPDALRARRGGSFVGASIPVCGVAVLVVVVQPWILHDVHEATLYVVAFQMRFQRTVVLMAQDEQRVPSYWGPPEIVRALCKLPFEMIPWQRMRYRAPKRSTWQLPIPPEREELSSSAAETVCSIEERMARTTVR